MRPPAPAVDLILAETACRRPQGKGQVVVDRQVWIERILLENERDIATRRRFFRHIISANNDAATVGALQPGNQAQRSGLAGTRGAKQDDAFSVGNNQIHIRDGRGFAEILVDALQDDFSHDDAPHSGTTEPPCPICSRRETVCRS